MDETFKSQAEVVVSCRDVRPLSSPDASIHTDDKMDGAMASESVVSDFVPVSSGAAASTVFEKQMTLREGLRLYPKAIAWSIALSTAIIMEGYDLVLLASFYSYPSFQEKYGVYVGNGNYQVPARWQTGLAVGANAGEILGLVIGGKVVERWGYRKTVIAGLSFLICTIFVNFFAQNLPTLLVGEILCGIPWGVFQLITTSYATEVMPTALRCYTTSLINAFWLLGQLTASGVLRGLLGRSDQWSYRIPFGLQWLWPPLIIVACFFAPESPWWLIRKGRIADAKDSLRRLTSPYAMEKFSIDDTIAMMVHTNELEKTVEDGTSYRNCFQGSDLRRTEITCGVYAVQNLCGSVLMGYSTYFFVNAGLSTSYSFDLSMSIYALGLIATVVSWFSMQFYGRRALFLAGLIAQSVLLLIIGCLGIPVHSASGDDSPFSWGVGALLIVFTFIHNASVGPVTYSLIGEMSSTRLRSKTIVLARAFYVMWSIVNNVWTPYMLNPTAWNWGALTAFFWLGMSLIGLVWFYFRVPEPRGKTYAELDVLFEKSVSARKFAGTNVLNESSHVRHRRPK